MKRWIIFVCMLVAFFNLRAYDYSIQCPQKSKCFPHGNTLSFTLSALTDNPDIDNYQWSSNKGGSFSSATGQSVTYTTATLTDDVDIEITLKFREGGANRESISLVLNAWYLPGEQFVTEKPAVKNTTQVLQSTQDTYNLYDNLIDINEYDYIVEFEAFNVVDNNTIDNPVMADHISGHVLQLDEIDSRYLPLTFNVRVRMLSDTYHCAVLKDFTVTLKVVDGSGTLPSFIRPLSPLPICQGSSNFDFHLTVGFFCSNPEIWVTYRTGAVEVPWVFDGVEPFTGVRLYKFTIDPSLVDLEEYIIPILVNVRCGIQETVVTGDIPITPLVRPRILGMRELPIEYDVANKTVPIPISLCGASLSELTVQGFPSGGVFLIYKKNGTDPEVLLSNGFGTSAPTKRDEFKFIPDEVFNDATLGNGDKETVFRIEYHYPENQTGSCPDVVSTELTFKESNDTDFDIVSPTPYCHGSILNLKVKNNADGEGDTFVWEFIDSEDEVLYRTMPIEETEYSYQFSEPGNYKIRLQSFAGIPEDGICDNDVSQEIRYGAKPKASFDARGLIEGQQSTFVGNNDLELPNEQDDEDDSDDADNVFRWFWNLNVDADPDNLNWVESFDGSDPTEIYEVVMPTLRHDTYNVGLITMAGWGCSDTTYRYLPVFHIIDGEETFLANKFPYIEDFDVANESNSFYQSGNFEQKSSVSSWDNSMGHADYKKLEKISPAWFTSTNFGSTAGNSKAGYYNNERSWIETPYFDLNPLVMDRPVIMMDVWSQLDENFDGVAIQYCTDEHNFGEEEWITIGDHLSGQNWYNSRNITSQPGRRYKQEEGEPDVPEYFLGFTNTTDTAWRLAAYPLDNVQSAAAGKLVRFRISFTSNGDNFPGTFEGFGFDNFRIENRDRYVLLESFISSDTKGEEILDKVSGNDQAVVIRNFVPLRQSDAAYPEDAADYNFNKADPGVRSLHYGLNELPRTIIDGTERRESVFTDVVPEDENLEDPKPWGEKAFELQCLKVAPFSFTNFWFDINDEGVLEVTAKLKNTRDIDIVGPYNVQVAIVSNTGRILRKLLPTAAGTRITSAQWTGTEYALPIYRWKPVTGLSFEDGIQVVFFIQDEYTKEVYQTTAYELDYLEDLNGLENAPDPAITQGRTARVADVIPDATCYPNPASSDLFVEFEVPLYTQVQYIIQNNVGTELKSGTIAGGVDLQRLLVSDLNAGYYTITLKTNGDSRTLSFIKQ